MMQSGMLLYISMEMEKRRYKYGLLV